MDNKVIINEILDYLKYKVNNNTCTPDELRNITEILIKDLNTIGTIDEMAEFFGVSSVNVRTLIHRKVVEKPKRKVYYRFTSILKNVPDKWLKKKRMP